MRTELIAELGTAHHGDVAVALEMIEAAAASGCDAVKIQHYGRVNPNDPQEQWLNESRLDEFDIARLAAKARGLNLLFVATAFDGQSLRHLREAGVTHFKVASSEAHNTWWERQSGETWFVSWPWGELPDVDVSGSRIDLTAIPLYPTPLECVFRAPLLDGWSDHTVGLSACQYAIVLGAQWVEAHLKLPGKTREREWEKTPEDFRALRQFAEDVETMRTGVGQVFRNRWCA